jgi:hypothetical protein
MILLHPHKPAPLDLYRDSPPVTVRWATPADEERLEVLAALDEAVLPPAPRLLGIVGDELWAAVSLSTGAVISDPFRRSAEVARLVSERGRQLTIRDRRPGRFPRTAWRRRSPAPGFRLG